MQVILGACGSAHLRPIARALQDRGALAGLWICDKNDSGISPEKYRRCWPYHLMMKPFYHLTSVGPREKMALGLFPVWGSWIRRQKPPPFDAVYAILGQGTELFDVAERTGALKVMDATSSHPTSSYGFWQRECDLWCPGARPGVPRWLFARANRELERADLILCPSKFVFESMLYNGVPETKCVLNPYGVDTTAFTQRAEVPQKTRFVCVGSLGLRKGQQYLLQAFDIVRKKMPDAELTCVGNCFPDFRHVWPKWQGTFKHYQNIPRADLARILREATAFVFPSNEEGFAKAVIEGMSAGLPIVATHESGATTLVEDGVEGIIVRARDVEGIANAMVKVASDRELNEKMGKAAYARGARNNTWGDYADRIIRIFNERAAARRQGSNGN
jgi:glycosyltransferase involved in cell wall biosynthesis